MSENYIQKAVREYWEEKPDWEKSITGMSRDALDLGAVKFKRPAMTNEAKLNLLRNELAYYHSKEREARRQAESVLRDLLEIRRTAPSVDMMVESALRRA